MKKAGDVKKMDLTIIVPFADEMPSVLFTLQAINQNLQNSEIEFEVIAIDNYCNQLIEQMNTIIDIQANHLRHTPITREALIEAHKKIPPVYENPAGASVEACAGKLNPWLKYIKYDNKLSHWNCKRIAVEQSTGKYILFLDAHTIPSNNAIENIFREYEKGYDGSMHMPLTYKILESRRLIYKLATENEYFYTYKFTTFKPHFEPYEVPCMSTCGMIISRDLLLSIGNWPEGLGIYGGGENWINFTLSVIGKKKYIYPHSILFHHGYKRSYHYEYLDFVRNRAIAHYLFGGQKLLKNFLSITKGNQEVLMGLYDGIIFENQIQRELIKKQQTISIEEWARKWMF